LTEALQIICPSIACSTLNDIKAETCVKCGLPLGEFTYLTLYPYKLFNMGLAAAKENRMSEARDLFASVVYWCPKDIEARNALAMTCYTLGDLVAARSHWEKVLKQSSSDSIALQGISSIEKRSAQNIRKNTNPIKKNEKKKVFGKKIRK
jgi:tetratricopeptide (TPR) repeat protein